MFRSRKPSNKTEWMKMKAIEAAKQAIKKAKGIVEKRAERATHSTSKVMSKLERARAEAKEQFVKAKKMAERAARASANALTGREEKSAKDKVKELIKKRGDNIC